MTPLSHIREQNRKEFEKLCHVNKFGECKYWNVEALGYSKSDSEAVHDKFFPQKVYDKTVLLSESRLLEAVKEKINTMPTRFPDKESDAYDIGYSGALSDLLSFVEEGLTKI